jgi:hypothetical protein
MGELCRLTASANDIHFNSREAAETFMASFEIGVVSALTIQTDAKGYSVSGQITCLGSDETQKQGPRANISNSDLCLVKRLGKQGILERFSRQGTCVRDGLLEEIAGPVEHEGYLIDYNNTTIRDLTGQDHKVPMSDLKILSLLSQSPKPYRQLFDEYNALDNSARPVGKDTFNTYVRSLIRNLGADAFVRTSHNNISLKTTK